MEQIIQKAAGMIEALPFIQRFRNETVVVKFGGSIMDDEEACRTILQDVAFMEVVGLRPVVVHGGGKTISRRMKELNLEPHFHHGLRVTDEASMAIVEEALNSVVNPAMVAMVAEFNCRAVGIHGQDILTAVRHTVLDPDTGKGTRLGLCGRGRACGYRARFSPCSTPSRYR